MRVLLEARGVSKHFGGLKAVDNVDMVINEGDIFGIIGPNGAGKTTFFNLCSGVFPVTDGEIFFNGENITNLRPDIIARKGMARTFQNIKLFNYMSVLENIKIGFHIHSKTRIWDAILHTSVYKTDEKMAEEKGLEIIERVGLKDYKDVLAGNLPYGMQRRVEIARALALDPKILLLDEPAAGMNPNETMALMEFIKKLNQEGYTIAVIEHDMKFVMNTCNRIMVLNFGKKICEGDPQYIRSNKEVNEAYFGKGIIVQGGIM